MQNKKITRFSEELEHGDNFRILKTIPDGAQNKISYFGYSLKFAYIVRMPTL